MNSSSPHLRSPENNASADSTSWTAATAPAALVNRTRRVVRERALRLETRRTRLRALFVPMSISAAILVIICTAVWSVLDQDELSPTGIPDASSQMLVFVLWFVPVSAGILAMLWSRRSRDQEGSFR